MSRASECLERTAFRAYRDGRAEHIRAGRSPRTYRYIPDVWHRDAVTALGHGEEERVMAICLAWNCGDRGAL